MVERPRAVRRGYSYHRYEGVKRENTIPRGLFPRVKYPGGVWRLRTARSASLERGHDVAREPAKLLLELLGRQSFGPVDHEVLEPGILRRDRLDAVDDVRGRAAEPGLLLDAVAE